MSTASTTPRLGLMSPTDSDPFNPDDFDATMQILDGQPGIVNVANYGSLPTGLTTNQHGSCYRQLDNGALWYWYQPSSGVGGVWKRGNSIGFLAQAINNSAVATTATSAASAATVLSQAVTPPGGRSLQIVIDFTNIASTGGGGIYGVCLYAGASEVFGHYNQHTTGTGLADLFVYNYLTPTPNTAITFVVKIFTASAAIQGSAGTATSSGAMMTICEI